MSTGRMDLTTQEQAHLRSVLRYLRLRAGTWAPVAKALHIKDTSLSRVVAGGCVSASLAFRVARLVRAPIDEVVDGRFPPTCPHCGAPADPQCAKVDAGSAQP